MSPLPPRPQARLYQDEDGCYYIRRDGETRDLALLEPDGTGWWTIRRGGRKVRVYAPHTAETEAEVALRLAPKAITR